MTAVSPPSPRGMSSPVWTEGFIALKGEVRIQRWTERDDLGLYRERGYECRVWNGPKGSWEWRMIARFEMHRYKRTRTGGWMEAGDTALQRAYQFKRDYEAGGLRRERALRRAEG